MHIRVEAQMPARYVGTDGHSAACLKEALVAKHADKLVLQLLRRAQLLRCCDETHRTE